MTYVRRFEPPPGAGFRVIAGSEQGLHRLLVVSGRLPAGDHGPMHLHAGEEVLRILTGEIIIRVGDERRTCSAGDVAIVPTNTLHGFIALSETLIEVLSERDIGTFFPVRQPDGTRSMVEVYRTDLPWSRPPPRPGEYTQDDEMQSVLRGVDMEV